MIEHVIKSNIFTTDHLYSSLESQLLTLLASLISLILFLFWYRKKALLNFQAWALLMFIINMVLFLDFPPIDIPIENAKNLELNLHPILMALMFLTSTVTIWKFWKLAERCLPKEIVYQQKYKNRTVNNNVSIKKSLLAYCLAIYHTFKNGGNSEKSCQKIKKSIKKIVKTR